MGIDPSSLNAKQRLLIAPDERSKLGLEAHSGRKWRLKNTLERDEQRTLLRWLELREAEGVLCYDWSRTDRRTTNRKGIADFRLYAHGRVLFGEMKLAGGKLSPEQTEMIEKFRRSGTEVQIWGSASAAIERIRDWLTLITYGST